MKKFCLMLITAILLLTSCGSKPEEAAPVSYGLEVFDSGIPYRSEERRVGKECRL